MHLRIVRRGRAVPKELACRKCRALTRGKICPICKSKDLSQTWSGYVIVIDPDKSEIAESLSIKKPGHYAIKVS